MNERPPRPPRAETPEIVELRQLKATQPELATAVDMQIALLEMQRRVQSRVPLPWIQIDQEHVRAQLREGRRVVRFLDLPIEWTDFRLALRQTADILLRFEALERADHDLIVALGREGNALEPVVAAWYDRTSGMGNAPPPAGDEPAGLDHVLVLALRPFLARCTEALAPQIDLGRWDRGTCPFCGWEADFAVITPSADRRLVCGRCLAQWNFAPLDCPFCGNAERAKITSFATRDGRYRVYGCDACKRYLKAYDARSAARTVMIAVDSIATLPLDAAAMQRGYV